MSSSARLLPQLPPLNTTFLDRCRSSVQERHRDFLTRSTLEGFSEHEELNLIVNGKYTGTSDTTEDIGTSTLKQRSDTFSSNDLASGIQGRLVFDSLDKLSMKQSRVVKSAPEYLLLLKSSSYADGWCRVDRKRYQHR